MDATNKTMDVPVIRFRRHGRMGGVFFSDATPSEYGGCGVPIDEDVDLYNACKESQKPFQWTIVVETKKNDETK